MRLEFSRGEDFEVRRTASRSQLATGTVFASSIIDWLLIFWQAQEWARKGALLHFLWRLGPQLAVDELSVEHAF